MDVAGWGGVYKILRKGGYQVSIVQNPTISLQDDAVATGVGLTLAVVIALEVGNIARFATAEKLAAYAGTTPRVQRPAAYAGTTPRVQRPFRRRGISADNP